jgi:hypothetical protein
MLVDRRSSKIISLNIYEALGSPVKNDRSVTVSAPRNQLRDRRRDALSTVRHSSVFLSAPLLFVHRN